MAARSGPQIPSASRATDRTFMVGYALGNVGMSSLGLCQPDDRFPSQRSERQHSARACSAFLNILSEPPRPEPFVPKYTPRNGGWMRALGCLNFRLDRWESHLNPPIASACFSSTYQPPAANHFSRAAAPSCKVVVQLRSSIEKSMTAHRFNDLTMAKRGRWRQIGSRMVGFG